MKKPDATTVITYDNFKQTVWVLPVKELLYVGRATQNKFKKYNIQTIGDLAKTNVKYLENWFGKIGRMLWSFANGYDTSPVSNIAARSIIKSVGNSTTTPRDLITDEDVKITMLVLCENVAERLREYDFRCTTVQISIRDKELFSFERQCKLAFPTCASTHIFDKAFELYKKHRPNKPIRSIGVRACNLITNDIIQLSCLPDAVKIQNQDTLEIAVDEIRNRFGHFAIQRAIMYTDNVLSNLDPKTDHVIHPVSFLK